MTGATKQTGVVVMRRVAAYALLAILLVCAVIGAFAPLVRYLMG